MNSLTFLSAIIINKKISQLNIIKELLCAIILVL